MPSNEAIELLENVLNEANNSRLKYVERLANQAKEMRNSGIKNYIKAPKVEKENIKKIQKYTTGDPDSKKYYPYGNFSSKLTTLKDEHEKDFPNDKAYLRYVDKKVDKDPKAIAKGNIAMNKTVGGRQNFKFLKNNIKNPSEDKIVRNLDSRTTLHDLPADDLEALAKAKKGKEAYMKDFGGPEEEYNSIHYNITYDGKGNNHPKYTKYGNETLYNRDYNKEDLKKRVENAKKNPHKVIGGYKLEAMYTITEALDKVLNEYEYDEDGANIVCESSCILIDALNTLLNE